MSLLRTSWSRLSLMDRFVLGVLVGLTGSYALKPDWPSLFWSTAVTVLYILFALSSGQAKDLSEEVRSLRLDRDRARAAYCESTAIGSVKVPQSTCLSSDQWKSLVAKEFESIARNMGWDYLLENPPD